jgi:hypothetical protein
MSNLVDNIIAAMLAEIEKHGLELMQHYPNDLHLHDRRVISRNAVAGGKLAWVVGHLHTHLAVLGIHPDQNEHTTWLTNLANADRFYLLEISTTGTSFTLKELTRDAFRALASTPIPYNRNGKADAFWLYKNKTRVGTCRTEFRGIVDGRRSYHAFLSVMEGASHKDKVALENWAVYASNELAGTLFRDLDFTWEPAIALAMAA